MKTIINNTGISYKPFIERFPNINILNSLFFDIETTGFSANNTKLYLIGIIFADKNTETFNSIQWFLDDYNDEASLIKAFIEFSKDYTTLIHYNGQGFDIPYMTEKCNKHKLDFDFAYFNHIDLYKHAYSIKNIFNTENLKQKTMEKFFDLNREDIFTGGDLITVYTEYMSTKDERALEFLLLHNYEDIKGMLTLMDILLYSNIFTEGHTLKTFSVESTTTKELTTRKEAIIEISLNFSLPKRVSFGSNEFYMTAFDDKLKIKINVYTDELKYFYPNYKDYYYLPEEDMSIHKSVAFYVDKNFRVKAKAATCYSKKTGQFLPQYKEIIAPYFKKEYNDKETYFEITDEFLSDTNEIIRYTKHILSYLINSK